MNLMKGLTLALGVATSLVILGSSGNAQEIRIGFVVPELSNELIANLDSGARQRAEELGNIEILTTGTNNGEDQARAVENYISMGVDLIAYDTIDSAAIGPAIIKANEAGIPVVAIISKAVSGKVESYISYDFLAMGRVIGRWVGGELGPDGIVAHVEGDPADPSGVALTDGFVLGIKEYGISGLVAQAPSNWSRVDGLNNATNMLTANPNISGFYGIIDDVAMGIVEAARAAGKLDSIIIAGANGSCEALRSVLRGELDFTLIAFSKPMGVQLIDTSMQVLNGETVPAFIASPSFGVDTALANAILDGTQYPPAALAPEIRQRLEAAQSGCG